MHNMRHYLSAFWSRLAGSALCELVELFGDKVSFPELDHLNAAPNFYPRDRVFNQWRTFWMFVGQVLSVTQTCREALRKAQAWLCFYNNDKDKNKKKKRFFQHGCLLQGSRKT